MNNKTRNILASLYIVALLMLAVGTTFSYFTTVKTSNINPAVEAGSAKTNEILFEIINKIDIYADASNFQAGDESITSSVDAKVTLTHGESDTSESEYYNAILNISTNEFEYSTLDKKPELILTVNGPDGEITNIDGLTYKNVSDNKGNVISGFDITNLEGKIAIVKNKEITVKDQDTNTAIENWKIKVTYVNLDASQNINFEKELNGTIQFERAEKL